MEIARGQVGLSQPGGRGINCARDSDGWIAVGRGHDNHHRNFPAWEREHSLRLDADRERNNALTARDQQRAALQQAVQAEAAAQTARSQAEAESRLSQASLQYLESMIQSSDPVSWVLQTSLGQ